MHVCAGIGELAALENLSSDTFVFTDNGSQWAVARYGTVRPQPQLPLNFDSRDRHMFANLPAVAVVQFTV